MTTVLRKGWCPGALRPMPAKDGFLVRLRITGGIVPVATAKALATAAQRYGNGTFDLSARANLQMRGVTPGAVPPLLDALGDLDLLDHDAESEARRNVVASPLAGTHVGLDIRPLVEALEARLASETTLRTLPQKFGFLIDDGSTPSLAREASDVRFDWIPNEGLFAIGLGGTRHEALRIGHCAPADLACRAVACAEKLCALQPRAQRPLRAAALMKVIGRATVARAFDVPDAPTDQLGAQETDPAKLAGFRSFNNVATLGLAVPFGRLDARMLATAASLAERGDGTLRLTPWRTILLPGVVDDALAPNVARAAGFVLDPADPRLRVAACVGREGCEHGTTSTRADAAALAPLAADLGPRGITLHVSGCAKGCAKPSLARVTLVADAGRYDIVFDGSAHDRPALRGVDIAEARRTIAALLETA